MALIRPPKGYISENDPRVSQIGHPAPPWLVNYADLMTELVCFFVILYALSAALNKNVQNAAEQVRGMIEKKEIAGDVKIDKEGLHITLNEQGKNIFFQSGSAELTPEMEALMAKIAPVLKNLVDRHEIIVEGHTDNIPIRNDLYLSNWELSTARATNVVEHLIAAQAFPPEKMAAMGYGEFRPVASNDVPAQRVANRRVVFFVKNAPLAPASSATAGKKSSGEPGEASSKKAVQSPGGPGFFKRRLSRIVPKWFNRP